MRLFVSNLDYSTRAEDVREFFIYHGYPPDAGEFGVKIITDRETGMSRGFGFVELSDQLDGDKAIKALDGEKLDGRRINVRRAEEQGGRRGGRGRHR